MTVTEKTLLRGAWYALEQAGELLDCASTLADAGKHTTATGIAMLGREELGRYRILRQLATDIAAGRVLSGKDVQAACEDHEEKQQAATLSAVMRPELGSKLAEAMRAQLTETPGSPAWNSAQAILDQATEALLKRSPSDRHRLRMRSFYVDLHDNEKDWSRPLEMAEQLARNAIVDAVNDYAVQRDRLFNVPGDATMMAARDEMTPHPEPLPPRWPTKLM